MVKDLEPFFALATLNSGLMNNSFFTFSLLKKPAVNMADMLRRAEKYVNAEEEMAARKQKMPWSGHQEKKGEHSWNTPGKKEKRKERSELSKETSDINSQEERIHPGEGHLSHPTITLPSFWTRAPEYLLWRRIRSSSNGLAH
ncbi:hypothetical protein CFOL_v3_09138 [Cephalotus follicularis]|uniref:Uncharacterized protein n=1 Tax=Cephalotus follicularis TaxID=3775 RepID=A0A1Q3BCV2_CEPFO|nr:hypothetical protein CFOL_v3_09138 [Cephalotus follicularis]